MNWRKEFSACPAENNSAEAGLKFFTEAAKIPVEVYGQIVRRKVAENL